MNINAYAEPMTQGTYTHTHRGLRASGKQKHKRLIVVKTFLCSMRLNHEFSINRRNIHITTNVTVIALATAHLKRGITYLFELYAFTVCYFVALMTSICIEFNHRKLVSLRKHSHFVAVQNFRRKIMMIELKLISHC